MVRDCASGDIRRDVRMLRDRNGGDRGGACGGLPKEAAVEPILAEEILRRAADWAREGKPRRR